MSNIILPGGGGGAWKETKAEESLRHLGHRSKKNAVAEAGGEFGANLLRKENAHEALKEVARVLHDLRNKMADLNWDDDKVLIVFGIQARNGWVKDVYGQWFEEDDPRLLDGAVRKALGK